MPPEIVGLFDDWRFGLLLVFLASPFVALTGLIVNAIITRVKDRGAQRVANRTAEVSETEAETHQFQAIIDGFEKSFNAVSQRATDAETASKEARELVRDLTGRVEVLETERYDAINHVSILEAMIPFPPGPPPRPPWMRPAS